MESKASIPWRNTWVGVIDVLGFSASLSANKDALALAYMDAISGLSQLSADQPLTDHTAGGLKYSTSIKIYSDSIIVIPDAMTERVADERSHNMNLYFVTKSHVRSICRSLLLAGLPSRGALAFGEIFTNYEGQIFMGDAITQAHAWEQAQDWAWFSVAPGSLERRLKHGPTLGGNEFMTKVPTKSGPIRTISYAPVLEGGDTQEVFDQLARVINLKLMENYSLGFPDKIHKWANTASFFSAFMPGYIRPEMLYKRRQVYSTYVR